MDRFELEHCGLRFILDIRDYQKDTQEYQDVWCNVNLEIKSNFMNYVITDDEMITCSEIDILIAELTRMLNGEKTKHPEFETLEPDLSFVFEPPIKRPYRGDHIELYLDVQFRDGQNGAYTDNRLRLALDRAEITRLRDYLVEVTKSIK